MHTSSNTNKVDLNKTVNDVDKSSDSYVVWLVNTLDPEKSAESALLLAEKMNVSISKMMHLLSRKPGPLSKPISKAKATKLAKVLESVGVKTEIISKDKLLQDKNRLIKQPLAPKLSTKIEAKKQIKAKTPEETPIRVDLDNILDRINANTEESKAKKLAASKNKSKRRNRSLALLSFLTLALAISYFAINFSDQIYQFAQGIISPVKAESAQNQPEVIETNLSSENLRELKTADLMTLAQAGSPKAQYELAYRYGSQGNYDSAVKWLFPVASNGLADAQYLLGLYFQYGHGVEQDSIKSQIWYAKAAEQGIEEAQRQLDLLYLKNTDNNDILSLTGQNNKADIFNIAKTASPAQLLLRLEPNQNLNQKDSYGQTPLMYAASQNTAESVQILINSGANPNLQSDDGWTAIMYASRDNPEVIRTLLINGADPEIKNDDGQTALDIAKENYENAEDYFVLDEF